MSDADQIRRWASAESELQAALDRMRPVIDAPSEAAAQEYLDHNELGLAMETLVHAALASSAGALPPEAVENLRAASVEMDGYAPTGWTEFAERFWRQS